MPQGNPQVTVSRIVPRGKPNKAVIIEQEQDQAWNRTRKTRTGEWTQDREQSRSRAPKNNPIIV